MNGRQGGREVRVALVGHEHERAGLRDERVPAGDADVRVEEALPKLGAGDLHERRRVVRHRMPDDLREELRDLLAGLVDRRSDEV